MHPFRYLCLQSATTDTGTEHPLTSRSKHVRSTSKSIGPRDSDGQPDDAKEEVDHHQPGRELENIRIPARWEIVDGDGDNEQSFRDSPDHSPELDVLVREPSWKLDLPNGELGYDVVGRRLNCYWNIKFKHNEQAKRQT